MSLSTYVTFAGTCEEAFKFYTQHLGGTTVMLMRYDSAPPGGPKQTEGWEKKIMHGSMTIGGTVLMGMDASPAMYQKPQGFYVSLSVANVAEAEKAWAALSSGGEIRMPLSETFFAKRFGMVADKFGVPWMVNCAP
ncbi:MAG TPA: VOC family protein [Rhizomicrobium sp.]